MRAPPNLVIRGRAEDARAVRAAEATAAAAAAARSSGGGAEREEEEGEDIVNNFSSSIHDFYFCETFLSISLHDWKRLMSRDSADTSSTGRESLSGEN